MLAPAPMHCLVARTVPESSTVDVKVDSKQAQDVLQSDGPDSTFELGRRLGELLAPGDVVGLVGDLGAGKTLFTQGVAAGLGCDPRYRVSSPTFTLINEHPGELPLIHVDLYRLDDVDEMVEIGLFEHFGGPGVCLVEWFDRLDPAERPRDRLELALEIVGDTERQLVARGCGERHERLLASFLAQSTRREPGRESVP